jgi:hypothetical protein
MKGNTMSKTLRLENFDIDADTSATINVYENDERIGFVKFDFGNMHHKVEISLPYEPYYVQTACADEAASLLDSRFDEDREAYDEITIDL